ncbi:FliM/FliN family flagellar motor switch protein [Litoreibacter albidus]|uniref:Flagellar motor switch protein FliM n=1 Tax=Litoreibacter albidus TaxID=670155 RepID=A0A1H2SML6_9RHOB|nr:FliM/FliN family flagellar motor switch protein [Litoreibacter albidus]SDW32279.1 flagellar motor switch protein FliM [Litoreibacter albidus]
MTGPNTALAFMVRPCKPTRGARHILLEDIADGLFRGPAKLGHGIDLLVRDAQAQSFPQAKALSLIPDIAVPHVLDGPNGTRGLLVFDGTLIDALIEQQTLGRISAAPRVERPVTAIDAALSTGFAQAVVGKLAEVSVDRRDASALAGYNCGAPQTDRAALSLAMSERSYDVLTLTLDLGPGLKTGTAVLMFPAAIDPAKPVRQQVNPDMVAALQDSELHLRAYLPSVRLPVKTLLGFDDGTIIPLPDGILGRAQLCDRRGVTLGKGRLGQLGGHRAFRLNGAPPPAQTPTVEMDVPPPAALPKEALPEPLPDMGEDRVSPEPAALET